MTVLNYFTRSGKPYVEFLYNGRTYKRQCKWCGAYALWWEFMGFAYFGDGRALFD